MEPQSRGGDLGAPRDTFQKGHGAGRCHGKRAGAQPPTAQHPSSLSPLNQPGCRIFPSAPV